MNIDYNTFEEDFRDSNRSQRLKSQKQRRGNHERRQINGPKMNHEGHEMAEVLFVLQFGRFPDETERREYQKHERVVLWMLKDSSPH